MATRIIVPGERALSWNQIYSGGHWSKRRDIAQAKHALVRAYIDPEVEPYKVPVDITIIAHFRARPIDPDNVAAKVYVDALKGWIIRDDDPRYVHSVRTISYKDPQGGDRLEILVEPVRTEPF